MPGQGVPLGVVLETEDGRAQVSTWRFSACGGCSEAETCGIAGTEACRDVVTVRNPVGARPGDTVELDLPGSAALRLSLLVWMVPAAGLLLGAVAGGWLAAAWGVPDRDVSALVGAVLGTALAFVVLHRIDRTAGSDPRLTPFIARVRERGSVR